MAPLLEDPRIRQTWNQISQNAETATETAAANIWTFQHEYINPCFASIKNNFGQCTAHCFPERDERVRRLRERGRTRGRAELSFDFYDDWDEEENFTNRGLLGGWGNDELDRLLAGSGSHSGGTEGVDQAPRRKRGMSYGTRGRRKSLDPDPTVIPSTSALGFLGRLPFKLGGTLRYKPSAADLQEHPGALRAEFRDEEGEPLISDEHSQDRAAVRGKGHTRNRSSTASSGETSDSFRSRGDLFPSDGEDDAVPLSDEFAMVLERRTTGSGMDDKSSGKTKSSKGKRPSGSRTMSRNLSGTQNSPSQPRLSLRGRRASSTTSLGNNPDVLNPDMVHTPSLADLQREEDRVKYEEEIEVERKRQAAAQLAVERGLQPDVRAEELRKDSEAMEGGEGVVHIDPPLPTDCGEASTVYLPLSSPKSDQPPKETTEKEFIPARLPHFS